MKNLTLALKKERDTRLAEFGESLKKVKKHEDITASWYYRDLIPKGKVLGGTLIEKKDYLIERKRKDLDKGLTAQMEKIKSIFEAGELVSVEIQIEWVRNRTWGNCPKGEAWVLYTDKDGNNSEYLTAGSVTGCGFDKISTIVANLLNQSKVCLKAMYQVKEKRIKKANRDAIAYGAGYGVLPSFEGGVGINCYPAIFAACGYKFETVASGKNFDVFNISKNEK